MYPGGQRTDTDNLKVKIEDRQTPKARKKQIPVAQHGSPKVRPATETSRKTP
jgi:hypothetical protein